MGCDTPSAPRATLAGGRWRGANGAGCRQSRIAQGPPAPPPPPPVSSRRGAAGVKHLPRLRAGTLCRACGRRKAQGAPAHDSVCCLCELGRAKGPTRMGPSGSKLGNGTHYSTWDRKGAVPARRCRHQRGRQPHGPHPARSTPAADWAMRRCPHIRPHGSLSGAQSASAGRSEGGPSCPSRAPAGVSRPPAPPSGPAKHPNRPAGAANRPGTPGNPHPPPPRARAMGEPVAPVSAPPTQVSAIEGGGDGTSYSYLSRSPRPVAGAPPPSVGLDLGWSVGSDPRGTHHPHTDPLPWGSRGSVGTDVAEPSGLSFVVGVATASTATNGPRITLNPVTSSTAMTPKIHHCMQSQSRARPAPPPLLPEEGQLLSKVCSLSKRCIHVFLLDSLHRASKYRTENGIAVEIHRDSRITGTERMIQVSRYSLCVRQPKEDIVQHGQSERKDTPVTPL